MKKKKNSGHFIWISVLNVTLYVFIERLSLKIAFFFS